MQKSTVVAARKAYERSMGDKTVIDRELKNIVKAVMAADATDLDIRACSHDA